MSSQSFSSAAVLILAAFLCFSTLAEARCNQDGWFGTNCQYKCHCAQSTAYDKVDGSCSSGCDPQWFGPACQYASIRLNESNWLTDNNDSTCYPNNGGTSLYLSLATPVPLTWIRVVHKGNVNKLRIMYKKDEQPKHQSCKDNANVVVDDHTMDFNCTTSHAVQGIYVDNEGFKSLCSLYISGGRNVALKQPTEQSSRLQERGAESTSWLSEYAVDGRLPDRPKEKKSNYETCTHSALNQTLNWWTVNFRTPVDVTRILIYNRMNCCRDRLKKFTLTVLQNGNEQYKVTGPDEEREMYSEVPSPKISSAVTQIKIQSRQKEILPTQKEILTLCEVEVFGELRCPTGWFGLACEHECHCDSQTNCFVHSGQCKAGCAPGYGGATCSERCLAGKYGRGCSQNCSQHCKGGKEACNNIDGKCAECKDGYRGERCLSECQSGKYGRRCSETCSQNCKGWNKACNHINGTCRRGCRDGYRGLKCKNKCQSGKYGRGCSQNCSLNCKGRNKACNHINGTCHGGCKDGYRGPKCENTCPQGNYGARCSKKCGEHCKSKNGNKVCNHISGICNGCEDGYTGDTCQLECYDGYYGEECKERCSAHCAGDENSCNHVNGTCDCDPGYNGLLCNQKCQNGHYGIKCETPCSEHCAGDKNPCQHVNGTCDLGCDPGYQGVLCKDKCQPGKFGVDCSLVCSQHCKGGKTRCDHVDGKCPDGCLAGYSGQNCQLMMQEKGESNEVPGAFSNALVIGIAVVVFLPVVVIAIFFLYRGRSLCKRGNREGRQVQEGGSVSNNLPREASDTNTRSFRKTSQRDKNNSSSVDPSVPSSSQSTGASPDVESAQPGELSAASTSVTRPLRGNTAVCVENLKNYILQHSTDSHFEDEFSSVPMASGSPQTQGTLPENVKKNRYKNIIPYDQSRVLLETVVGKKNTDYINASYVQGYKRARTFIASQGPTDPLLNDFVRMLWEQRVDKIVMLTNLVEEGKKKCSMYWPEDGEKQFDGITMKLLTVHIFAEYTIRNLRLSKKGEPFRYLTQFHFTAWPDKSVPESPWGLVDLYQRVTAAQGEGPVLVHCSAGVGRSGTFIGLCNLLQEANATGKMDFYSTLWNLRQCREQTVQTLEQYICLHHAALVGHVISETTLKEDDIDQRLSSLEENSIAHNYKQEFEALVEVCDVTSSKQSESPADEQNKSVYLNMKDVANMSKDRLGNISPSPSFRAELIADSHHKDTYINAVLVPNMIKDRQDILTQLPMAATVTDFWRLVTQFDVGLVVVFDTDLKDTDESIVDFFNMTVKERFEKDGFIIETKTSEESKLVTEFSLIVQQKSKRAKRPLTLLLCKIQEMETRSLYKIQEKILSRRPMKSSRTVYMCRNGADKCGLVCIQSILLERMKQDHCLSVPLVVGKIKAIRRQVIPTVEQYKSLYLILKLAHESENVYNNVGASSF